MNRTAWADVGDGVLFYDPDGTCQITETRQYVFTEWDPTASSDLEALRSVFDTHGNSPTDTTPNGVFDQNDEAWNDFKVMVTKPAGTLEAKTLTEVGIVSIDLTPDATQIELPDGSVITGLTTMQMADGTTHKVADMALIAETGGVRLEEVESVDGAGVLTVVQTGYNADGTVAFEYTSVTSADDLTRETRFDDDGDGVVDRIQLVVRTGNSGTPTTKDVSTFVGAMIATAILVSRTVTTADASGKVMTIERDSTGGGWFDQVEHRLEQNDGSLTITIEDRANDAVV